MSFLVVELIRKKREGLELNEAEIAFLIDGISQGTIPDYQSAAFLMAAFLKGLSPKETETLTIRMKNSGRSLNWRELSPKLSRDRFADKHSTGGIGDKVSLILAPLAAELGLKVPMMSGRGLGHTGGTVDKLESVVGLNLYLNQNQMLKCLEEVGVCMMAQAADLCPADRKLYALRDVTATVESIPLICGSILSKKAAEGAENIVFDVKVGSAAFMENIDRARELANALVRVGKGVGLNCSAWLTRMEEPLGAWVGNAVEILESIKILKNEYASESEKRLCAPLRELCIVLTAEMLALSGAMLFDEAKTKAADVLESGKAYERFKLMLETQGAKQGWEKQLKPATIIKEVRSEHDGFIHSIHSRDFGMAGIEMAMGRHKAEDKIDPNVGFEFLVRPGDIVKKNQILYRTYLTNESDWTQVYSHLENSVKISTRKEPFQDSLLIERISV